MSQFCKKIFCLVGMALCFVVTGCGSKGSSGQNAVIGTPGGGSDEEGNEGEIVVRTPVTVGPMVVWSSTEHVEVVLSTGDLMPITESETESGTVQVEADLLF